jgi:hypothetical protein
MPIDSFHPSYASASTAWKRVRNAASGQEAIHAAGKTYLPALPEQTPEEYEAYKSRAVYFNATGRTQEALIGLVNRRSPTHDFSHAAQYLIDDVSNANVTAAALSKLLLSEVLITGRAGLLVEYPHVDETPSSAAAAAAQGLRPYISMYTTESIRNWREARINNVLQPVLVVLEESYEESVDEWTSETKTQFRELTLIEGVYHQRLWRASASAGYVIVDDIVPISSGAPLTKIPFVAVGSEENTLTPAAPPLSDLVDMNLAHYRTTADYEHACHWVCIPTAWIAGHMLQQGEVLKIGSPNAWVFQDANAKTGFLEFTGQGLGPVVQNLASKEQQMAALGARMLAPDKAAAEATQTLQLRANGEYSALASVTNNISEAMTAAIRLMCAWAGISGTDLAAYRLNTDYLPTGLTAQEITALVGAWQSGAISKRSLFAKLQRGEVVAADLSYDDEQEFANEEGPLRGIKPAPAANDPQSRAAA